MDGIDWFPEGLAHSFYIFKGVLALVGTCLLVAHMIRKREPMTPGQTLRYLALLSFAALVTGASVEQTHQEAVVNYRNLAAIPVVALLIVAAVVSLYETRRKR